MLLVLVSGSYLGGVGLSDFAAGIAFFEAHIIVAETSIISSPVFFNLLFQL